MHAFLEEKYNQDVIILNIYTTWFVAVNMHVAMEVI